MGLKTQITYTGPGAVRPKVKGFAKTLKAALTAALALWHQKFLPQHFGKQAYYRYPGIFQKRHGIVENKKLLTRAQVRTRLGLQPKDRVPSILREPMLVSGTLMRNATRQITITGSAKTLRGRLPGTQAANFFPRANAPYHMRAELVTVNEAEEKEMDALCATQVSEFLARNSDSKTVTA